MAVSHKYRTFNQLLEDVTVDFRTYALEGMIEPQQLIKVAVRVNYDLGLKIQRTKSAIIDIENSKGKLPSDFNVITPGMPTGPCGWSVVHYASLGNLNKSITSSKVT